MSGTDPMLPGGVPPALPWDRRIERAGGGWFCDDRGTRYVDLILGYGAVSVGHAEPAINQAVSERLAHGTLLPGRTALLDRVEEALRHCFPSAASVSFHKTGSEAVAAALRLARWRTGRTTAIRCGFHGWHDALISPSLQWHELPAKRQPAFEVPGVAADGARSGVVAWTDGEPTTLVDLLQNHADGVAAVLVDPVQLGLHAASQLCTLRRLCDKQRCLLILDELKTFPRVSLGGAQALAGITADLTIVGKGAANGFPFAAVLGPDWITEGRRESRIMGTFNGELSAFAAVIATLQIFSDECGPRHVDALGRLLIETTADLRATGACEVEPGPWPSMPRIRVLDPRIRPTRLCQTAIKHGLAVLCPHMSFIALRHTEDDIVHAAVALQRAIESSVAPEP
jgi:glutamate-1-semialdehyde 2,1-aminomutase